MTPDEILGKLNPEQAEAARTINGPVLVLAGAGTGKTRVITYRIAYMLATGIPPAMILGMTFTNKAAREMKERLATLAPPAAAKEVTLGTFHSFCGRLLRHEIHRLGYLANFTIADESDQQGLLKQAAGSTGYNYEGFPIAAAGAQIGKWKNRLLTPREASSAAENDFESRAARIYEAYQELLELQNAVDFDDLLLLAYRVLAEFPEVLAAYRDRYRYLLVDEYQDTNAAQFAIVKLLAGDTRNLCVVGDDDQSIYSWRGADVGNILDFPEFFPGTKVVRLEQNYRSMTSILNAANAAISANRRRHEKKLWSSLGDGELPCVVTLADGEAEGDFIADMIRQIKGRRPELDYSDFAILYRSNQLSRQLEQSLRNASLPYQIYGGQQFYQRREIKDAVAYLKLVVNPHDDQSVLRILGTPPRGLGAKVVEALKNRRVQTRRPMMSALRSPEFIATLSKAAQSGARELAEAYVKAEQRFASPGGLAAKIGDFLEAVGYLPGLQKIYKDLEDARKRRDNLDEFINAVAQFEARRDRPATLAEFLESFALLEEEDRDSDGESASDGVVLSTIHAAKGLEFPVVFLVAMERDIFPHERALAERAGDEELRLFYVALTRAKEQLFLTRTRLRMVRGIKHPAQASPFLALLGETAEVKRPEELLTYSSTEDTLKAFRDFYASLKL